MGSMTGYDLVGLDESEAVLWVCGEVPPDLQDGVSWQAPDHRPEDLITAAQQVADARIDLDASFDQVVALWLLLTPRAAAAVTATEQAAEMLAHLVRTGPTQQVRVALCRPGSDCGITGDNLAALIRMLDALRPGVNLTPPAARATAEDTGRYWTALGCVLAPLTAPYVSLPDWVMLALHDVVAAADGVWDEAFIAQTRAQLTQLPVDIVDEELHLIPSDSKTPAGRAPRSPAFSELATTILTPGQLQRAAAALDIWFTNPGGSDYRVPGHAWDQDELLTMHAALEAPTLGAALQVFLGEVDADIITPKEEAQARRRMAEVRRRLNPGPAQPAPDRG